MSDNENYVEASLPDEMNDMQDGEERESVCKIKRKGDKMCITHVGGTAISPAKEDESAAEDSTEAGEEGNPGPSKKMSKNIKPSDFMKSMPGMQKY